MNCDVCSKTTEGDERCWEAFKNEKLIARTHEACYQQRALDRFFGDGTLTSNLCLTAALRARDEVKWQPVVDADNRIHAAVKYFERAAWFGGADPELKEQKYEGRRWTFPRIEKSIQSLLVPVRGLSGKHGGIDMLVYAMAGRAMVTLKRGDATITVITADDEQTDRMGRQGICATEKEATALLLEAGAAWDKFDLKPDEKIGIGL